MLKSIINSTNQIFKLHLELSNYGLQPVEWTLQKHTDLTFKIKNKSEENFYFIGQIQNKKSSTWSKISLAGL